MKIIIDITLTSGVFPLTFHSGDHNANISLHITWRLLVFKHPGFAHKLFVAVCSKCTNLLVAYGIVWNEHVCNLPAIADRIKIEFSL